MISIGWVHLIDNCNKLSMACVGSSVTTSIGGVGIINVNRYSNISSSYGNKIPLLTSGSTRRRGLRIQAEKSRSMATEIAGVKIIKNPPESKLTDLGVRSWPKWGCPSKFPWTYSAKETCYLLKGKLKVYPDGCDEVVEIGAGDLVEFPKGMSCTWDVSEQVEKHYNFE